MHKYLVFDLDGTLAAIEIGNLVKEEVDICFDHIVDALQYIKNENI